MPCIIESNGTCTLLDCSDSKLSISANVVGILTFAIALIATYLAFFQDVRDIPTVADDYSNDIRSLHDQLWAIGDIHGQLAKLIADSEHLRLSDVHLQSRLKQGQSESLKEARKFLDDYSAAYQSVFTDYFKKRRWFVRLKWLTLQKRVEHFKANASVLRETLTLDLINITLNMNIALQQTLRARDAKRDELEEKLENLTRMSGHISPKPQRIWDPPDSPDGPSPTGGLSVPAFVVSAPRDDSPDERVPRRMSPRPALSRSPSPFSPGRRLSA